MVDEHRSIAKEMSNGAGGAAVVAAGVGSFVLAVLAIAADQIPDLRQAMIFFRPTGPLSGVTTCAVVMWLACWVLLHFRWRNRTVPLERLSILAIVLLCLSVVLTFPGVANLF